MRQTVKNASLASLGWLVLFALLLVLPLMAAFKAVEALGPVAVLGYIFVINGSTGILYAWDKRNARLGKWRISERTLHLAEVLGGIFIAFWMQRWLRHKIRKLPYQLTFWLIVLLQQCLLYDYLHSWRYSQMVLHLIQL
jgi:uncharacterized membrane protein YsdA (DUF1294 family)